MLRSITILGATGSIGQNTLDLISRAAGDFRVEALTGARNIVQLAKDAVHLRARLVVTSETELYNDLKALLAGVDVEIAAGPNAVADAAAHPADWVMSGIVGAAGLVLGPGQCPLSGTGAGPPGDGSRRADGGGV